MSSAGELVGRWARRGVMDLSAYHVQPAAGLIKLDAMENPYALPPELDAAWRESLAQAPLNRYPDGAASETRAALARVYEVPACAEILLGNGSDELLQLVMTVFGGPDRCVLTPVPTFSMYEVMANLSGTDFVGVPMAAPAFQLDVPAMLDAIELNQPAVVILASPNNPTGVQYPRADLEAIIEAAPGIVVVDEAYAPFATDSVLPDLARYPNVLCVRTLSKMGLAGIRLGFGCADPTLVDALDRARLPYNINLLTQLTANFLLAHYDVLAEQVRRIITSRTRFQGELDRRESLRVTPSDTNFVLMDTGRPGGVVFEALRDRGVLVKSMERAHASLRNAIRVTIGTDEEMDAFLAGLDASLGLSPAR